MSQFKKEYVGDRGGYYDVYRCKRCGHLNLLRKGSKWPIRTSLKD